MFSDASDLLITERGRQWAGAGAGGEWEFMQMIVSGELKGGVRGNETPHQVAE